MARRPAAVRFWSHVQRGGATDCWHWTGAITPDTGYGVFRQDGGRLVLAHCFSWELAHPGESRAGLVVRHSCDVRHCVNPAHLAIGTHADNTADMDARGRRRSNPVRGEAHAHAKLSREAVAQARDMRRAGLTIAAIAEMFGVAPTTMSAALSGRSWSKS